MTDSGLPPASDHDNYIRTIEDANRRWKTAAEAIDSKYDLQLARPNSDQSPAALHSQYLRQRDGAQRTWQGVTNAAIGTYRGRTGHQQLPNIAWTPEVPGPLPGPGQPAGLSPSPRKPRTPKPAGPRRLLIAGAVLVLGVIGLGALNANKSSTGSSTGSTAVAPALSSTVQVLYEVEGTATGANLTLESGTGTVQLNDKAVPLGNKTSGKRGITYPMTRGHFVYLSAQNKGSSGTITCRITVDGVVVSTNTSSGGYAIASCSGTAR